MNTKNKRHIHNRYALLIGVNEYLDNNYPSLQESKNDVISLGELLIQLGYKVRLLHCQMIEPERRPTKEDINYELEQVCTDVGEGDLLLIYYSGHGTTANGKAYLVPLDADKTNLAISAIDLDEFKEKIIGAGAQAKILFLDACRAGNERVRDGEGMSPEFERHIFLEAGGTATFAACMHHEFAWNYDNNGVFTHYLMEGLNGKAAQQGKRFITFNDINVYVTDKVRTWGEAHGHKQTPNSSTHLVGDPALVEFEDSEKFYGGPGGGFSKEPPGRRRPANPFNDIMAIVEPVRFIGRTSEMRRLWNLLQAGSVTLKGDHKIGKSSMLLNLAQKWPGRKIGPINFDQLGNADDFYKYIAGALGLMSNSWESICRALENSEALLLLDEMDAAPKRGITHDDMSHFRALCEINRDFKIVAVSRAPLKEVFPDTGNGSPLYNILQPLTLEELKHEDAFLLLEHTWAPEAPKFTPAACQELLLTAGYHPFKLKRAAFHYYEFLSDSSYHWKEAFQHDLDQML
ncbi:MAG: caspase family protein [Acidobacteria bacterium]|nr:caspase family protein [Acidobacteriota bacterium]